MNGISVSFLDRHIRVALLLASLVSEGKAAARDVTMSPVGGVLLEKIPDSSLRMKLVALTEVKKRL